MTSPSGDRMLPYSMCLLFFSQPNHYKYSLPLKAVIRRLMIFVGIVDTSTFSVENILHMSCLVGVSDKFIVDRVLCNTFPER